MGWHLLSNVSSWRLSSTWHKREDGVICSAEKDFIHNLVFSGSCVLHDELMYNKCCMLIECSQINKQLKIRTICMLWYVSIGTWFYHWLTETHTLIGVETWVLTCFWSLWSKEAWARDESSLSCPRGVTVESGTKKSRFSVALRVDQHFFVLCVCPRWNGVDGGALWSSRR